MITILFLLAVAILGGIAFRNSYAAPDASSPRVVVTREVGKAFMWAAIIGMILVTLAYVGGVRGIPLPR